MAETPITGPSVVDAAAVEAPVAGAAMAEAPTAEIPLVVATGIPGPPGCGQSLPALLKLPNEILLQIAFYLPLSSLFRLIVTCRFFHDLLIKVLYRNDILTHTGVQILGAADWKLVCCLKRKLDSGQYGPPRQAASRSVRWGCNSGNLNTLRRALEAGADFNSGDYSVLTMAISGEEPTATVAFLLGSGADPNSHQASGIWCLLRQTLISCEKHPRWCPVPVVRSLLEHGGKLRPAPVSYDSGEGLCAMDEWRKVMTLGHTHGPRRRWVAKPDGSGEFVPHHDHCLHPEHCSLVMTKLLLTHGADPNFRRSEDTLVTLAMRNSKRPVQLMSCLAAAGADLDRARPMQFALSPSFHEQWSRRSLENPGPLQLAVEEAVRINSLTRHPRGGGWSIYPEIQFGQAPSIVKFLLCQGVSVDKRSRMLLNKWDPAWRKYYKPRRWSSRPPAPRPAQSDLPTGSNGPDDDGDMYMQ